MSPFRSNKHHPHPIPRLALAVGVILLALVARGTVAHADLGERSESPRILVTSDVEGPDPLPLKETRAEVQIAGVIAHVKITQTYENEGSTPLEAVYVFPGSTRAAVFGMRMQIGERIIEAKIDKKEAARQQYERAKESGKTASLLEEHRPNVFQMNVANVLPGDTVKVELDYTELLVPEDGTYEFVYPAVVGPRFTGEDHSAETWHQNPYGSQGAPEPYGFSVQTTLNTGMGIAKLSSPSHKIEPKFDSADKARVEIGGAGSGNRDFVLRYRLKGDAIETGMLRFEGDDENFFLMMMQPPEKLASADIPPREYVFIVDVSGSMYGYPLDVSKAMMKRLLGKMRPVDRFNVLFFAGGSYQLHPKSVPASAENIQRAIKVIDERSGSGGTELLQALQTAFAMPASEDTSRTFIILTDGYVSVEKDAFALIRNNLDRANFFAFGIGSSVNRHLIEGMARAGRAEPFVVLDQSQAQATARRFQKMVESPVLTNIKVAFKDMQTFDVEPRSIPDLLADRPILVYGKYKGSGGAIEVSGSTGKGRFEKRIALADSTPATSNEALRYLWARRRVQSLSDGEAFEAQNNAEAITKLGLRYNLLTEHTSFIAVDTVARNSEGSTTVKQPLPLPQGVSGNAVGVTINTSLPGVQVDGYANARGYSTGMLLESIALRRRYSAPVHFALVDDENRTSSMSPYGLGQWNLALAPSMRVSRRGGESVIATPLLLRLGLSPRLEARLASQLASVAGDSIRSPDVQFGLKAFLFQAGDLGVGLVSDLQLDFSDKTPETSHLRARLLLSYSLAYRLMARFNLGYERLASEMGPALHGVGYSAELAHLFGEDWIFAGGLAGLSHSEATALSLEAAANYRLNRVLSLGAAATVGATDAADDFGARLYLRFETP